MREMSLRKLLRERTIVAHADLERTPLMQAFATGDPDQCRYLDYLGRQLRLHRGLEFALSSHVPAEWAGTRLSKSAWLAADLRALDTPCDVPAATVPVIRSWAEALGALYVIEGSTLGLQAVRKRMRPEHPARRGAGRFVEGYGDQSAQQWRAFLGSLETLPGNEWAAAERAACATFEVFHCVFSEPCA